MVESFDGDQRSPEKNKIGFRGAKDLTSVSKSGQRSRRRKMGVILLWL